MRLLIFTLILLYKSENHKLTVEIEGLTNKKGNIRLALYNKNNVFPSEKDVFKNSVQSSSNKFVIFNALKEDKYAIAVFHDENKNGILDKNIFGVPTEKYGFSNNARAVFSAPSFDEAAFSIKSDSKISIKLK